MFKAVAWVAGNGQCHPARLVIFTVDVGQGFAAGIDDPETGRGLFDAPSRYQHMAPIVQ